MSCSEDPRPSPPPAPDPSECCGGGCLHCVFNLHDAAWERYEKALAAWIVRQQGDPHAAP